MLQTYFTFVLAFSAPAAPPAACTEAGTNAATRADSYEIAYDTCVRELGVAVFVCEAARAMAWRESRGAPGSVHTRGKGEFGLGLYGHAPKFWGWTLRVVFPRAEVRERLCDPRWATIALVREFQYAVDRGAVDLRGLQRVHSGRRPADESRPWKDNAWCHLLENGPKPEIDDAWVSWVLQDCRTPVTAADLGPRLDAEAMAALAEAA